MSELSAQEKQRILRERRKQKFSQGGATQRLTQITSQTSSSFLNTSSPLDEQKPVKESTPPPTSLSTSESNTNDMDALLKEIMGGAQKSGKNGADPMEDMFNNLMSQMGGAGSPFGGSGSPFGETEPIGTPQTALNTYNQNKLKAQLYIVKLAVMLPALFYLTKAHAATSFAVDALRVSTPWFTYFVTFEIVMLSIFATSVRKTYSVESKILGYLDMVPLPQLQPIKRYYKMFLQYWDFLQFIGFDFALVLVWLGLFSY